MKLFVNPRILPYFTHLAGVLGFALHIWLRATGIDEKNLYIESHPALILMFILTAVVLPVLYLAVQPLQPQNKYHKLFPVSPLSGLGSAAAALGIGWCAIRDVLGNGDLITSLTLVAGIAACACLLFTGYCRSKGAQPNFRLYAVIAVYMMLRAACVCRLWSRETQMVAYFFPLLASVFLVLCTYQHTVLACKKGSSRRFVLTNQIALFFCWLSVPTDPVFYLTMCAYLGFDLCALQAAKKHTPHFLKEKS